MLFGLVFLLVYLPAIELEEQHLRDIFSEYAAYANASSVFCLSENGEDVLRRSSWKQYWRNEEYKAAAGFVIAASWLVIRLRS